MKLPDDWIVPDWPAPPRVRSFITTRSGGVSNGAFASMNLGLATGDDARSVKENRSRLMAHLPQAPKWLHQVHGAGVVVADDLDCVPDADAAIARRAGTVCTIMVADCLPVMLCDEGGSVVGLAHAGWRGACSGVIENTVREMAAPPGRLLAYLGPAIGPEGFEVGEEVRASFIDRDVEAAAAFTRHRATTWLADLFTLARQRLRKAGVRRIYGGGLCTFSDAARFYSYRRDKITGRMAALIWMEP